MKPVWLLLAFGTAAVAAAVLLPALPQPVEYHDFADQRTLLGVANFLDVATNAGFLLAGLAGLLVAIRSQTAFEYPVERWPYVVFFLGVTLTAVGSAYYHLAPDNERLFWDRLPMTIAFMSLIAAQIMERFSVRAGLLLLLPMLLVGAAAAIYWLLSERAGVGNVIPYVVLQAAAVAGLLLIALLQDSRYTRGRDLHWVFAYYLAAKLLEMLDREILAFGHLLSGHSLKHIMAALAALIVCRMLVLRSIAPASITPATNHR
jgi:hypothetical protein